MTGEELNRKYHELCGWRQGPIEEAIQANFPRLVEMIGGPYTLAWTAPDGGGGTELPPLHLDANLAIAEADRVFLAWHIRRHSDKASWDFFGSKGGKTGRADIENVGGTFCKAILKALIAAKERP